MELNLLIDKAASIAGSRYKLAKQLKVSTSNLYAWEKGKACPPGDIALMAAIAGYDPVQWLVRATLEKYEGTEKGDQLARALGKPSPATGEATALGGADAPGTSSQDPDEHSTMYRNVNFSTHRPERLRRFFFAPQRGRTSHRKGTRWPARWRHQSPRGHSSLQGQREDQRNGPA